MNVPGPTRIEEIPPRRPIQAALTGVTAFVGSASAGPVAQPVRFQSAWKIEETFGGFGSGHALGYALRDFFLNGGGEAFAVRTRTSLAADVEGMREALRVLEATDFDLLALLPDTPQGDVPPALLTEAIALCERRRAMLLVDAPSAWAGAGDALAAMAAGVIPRSRDAALYFPRLHAHDGTGGREGAVSALGAVAGCVARTDARHGVWKSPAGSEATLYGFTPALALNNLDAGRLNPLASNAIRSLPYGGTCLWGGRTLRGADGLADDYKYLAVRRLALLLQRSLDRGLDWVVFEADSERLRSDVRREVETFLHGLFRDRAFSGNKPSDAFFAQCEPAIVGAPPTLDLLVGFAPIKPAEFLVFRLQKPLAPG